MFIHTNHLCCVLPLNERLQHIYNTNIHCTKFVGELWVAVCDGEGGYWTSDVVTNRVANVVLLWRETFQAPASKRSKFKIPRTERRRTYGVYSQSNPNGFARRASVHAPEQIANCLGLCGMYKHHVFSVHSQSVKNVTLKFWDNLYDLDYYYNTHKCQPKPIRFMYAESKCRLNKVDWSRLIRP